jgi:hypothetical protein
MYVDTFIVPEKEDYQVVLEMNSRRTRKSTTYTMRTNVKSYDINHALYTAANPGDTLTFFRSAFTGVHLKALLDRREYAFIYDIGFLNSRGGFVLVSLTFLGTILLAAFYRKLTNVNGRRNIVLFVLIVSVVFLLFYLDI